MHGIGLIIIYQYKQCNVTVIIYNYPNTVLLKIYRSFLAQNFVPANSIKFTSLSKIIIDCYPQPFLQVIYTQPQNKHPSSVQLAEKNIALAVDYIIIISPGSLIMKCPYNYSGEETLRLLHVGSCSSVVRVLKLEVLHGFDPQQLSWICWMKDLWFSSSVRLCHALVQFSCYQNRHE